MRRTDGGGREGAETRDSVLLQSMKERERERERQEEREREGRREIGRERDKVFGGEM